MFDGWKHGTIHYIAVIAVYMIGDKCKEVLLGFSPPLDEKTYTAEAHRDLLISIVEMYGRSVVDIVVIIGDNCATNKATATLLGVPLLGCACHKLNLAVKLFIKEQHGAVAATDCVSSLASKANNLKAAAALRELTELGAIRSNDTRWSSTYQRIKRFFDIEDELRQVHEVEMPRRSHLHVLRELLPTLTKFDSVMAGLQKQVITLSSARGTIDEMLEDYHELGRHLAQGADIVHDTVFKAAVVKIQTGRVGELSAAERSSVTAFQIAGQAQAQLYLNWTKHVTTKSYRNRKD